MNQYLELFSCVEYVYFEYKQHEQFIHGSFPQEMIGTHTKFNLVFHWNNSINFGFVYHRF